MTARAEKALETIQQRLDDVNHIATLAGLEADLDFLALRVKADNVRDATASVASLIETAELLKEMVYAIAEAAQEGLRPEMRPTVEAVVGMVAKDRQQAAFCKELVDAAIAVVGQMVAKHPDDEALAALYEGMQRCLEAGGAEDRDLMVAQWKAALQYIVGVRDEGAEE